MRTAPPYRFAPKEAVQAGPWTLLGDDSKQHPLPKFLTGWDYQTVLRLSREAKVDVAEIRTAARLDGDVELRLGVLWSVAETALRGRAARASPVRWRRAVPSHRL